MDVALGSARPGAKEAYSQGGHCLLLAHTRKTSPPSLTKRTPFTLARPTIYRSSRMGPPPHALSSPPSVSSLDAATLLQEKLDIFALASFNAVLEVSRAQGQTNEGGHRRKASQLGLEIGTVLREIEEAIETLPVIPLPAGGPGEHANSVVATRKRLKELQAEYERVHHELEETVNEAEKMSQKLRSTLAYNK